jgi:phosphoribosyl 1,2-cyclic phosphate phosphodiesterase
MNGASIPVLGHQPHLDALQSMFPYCFGRADDIYRLGSPSLTARAVAFGQAVPIAGVAVLPIALDHGPGGQTTGFRCGGMAYLTDLKSLPSASRAMLRGLDLLALDMLREEPHPTHLCWAEAEEVIADLKPRRTVLTHLGHEVRYAQWRDRLPPTIELAHDGWHADFTTP